MITDVQETKPWRALSIFFSMQYPSLLITKTVYPLVLLPIPTWGLGLES